MALSMAVLLVPLGLFYVMWDWAASDRQVSVVDTSEDRASATALGLDVIEPELSPDWKPISSALEVDEETVILRTGWYSPDGDGLQLVQTNGEMSAVNEKLDGAGEPVEAAGLQWAAYDLGDNEAWVTELPGSTVVLTADPEGIDELPELAEGVAAGAAA